MMMMESEQTAYAANLSAVVVPLLKGVTYRADDAAHWDALLQLQGRVRDYVAVLGLELTLDEAEGYAFLRSRPETRSSPGSRSSRVWWTCTRGVCNCRSD